MEALGLWMVGLGIVSVLANDRMFNPDAPLPQDVVLWVRLLQLFLIVGGMILIHFSIVGKPKK